MADHRITLGVSGALAALAILLATGVAAAQGSVTPSFGDGTLTLVGEGYRSGERVEITVRITGATQPFSATADARGRFRLATGLQVPPMSRVEIEARDEHGLTQVTTTSGPGAQPGPGGGMPVAPPGPGGGMPLPPTGPGGAVQPPAPTPGPGVTPRATGTGGIPMPTQLPRTGGSALPAVGLVALALASVVGGLLLWGRARSRRA